MIAINLDARPLARLRTAITGTPRLVQRATVRAINKTLSWGESQGRRAIARDNKIPAKVLSVRGRVHRVPATDSRTSGVLWFGIAPVKAIYAGNARRIRKGVRVGRTLFEGAFLATMRSGHTGVFKRRGDSRLPIVEQTIALTGAAATLNDVAARMSARLKVVFDQELRFELSKLGGKA